MVNKKNLSEHKVGVEISIQDFLAAYKSAYMRHDMKAIYQLHEKYPNTFKLAFDEVLIDSLSDPADKEYLYLYPILAESERMTEIRVLNILAYLRQTTDNEQKYKDLLHSNVIFRPVFNYTYCCYQKDYDKSSLWNDLFLKDKDLHARIVQRHIQSFSELVYRTYEYFESAAKYFL